VDVFFYISNEIHEPVNHLKKKLPWKQYFIDKAEKINYDLIINNE